MTPRAKADLIKAGYVRLPPLWVPEKTAEQIMQIAGQHKDDVLRIRREARNDRT